MILSAKIPATIHLPMAIEVAESWIEIIRPYCDRISLSGDVRLGAPEIADIWLLYQCSCGKDNDRMLAIMEKIRNDGHHLESFWYSSQRIKLNVKNQEGISLWMFENFSPMQWGLNLVSSTGPLSFTQDIFGRIYRKLGSRGEQHTMAFWDGDRLISMPEEGDVFKFCDLPAAIPFDLRRGWKKTYTAGDL